MAAPIHPNGRHVAPAISPRTRPARGIDSPEQRAGTPEMPIFSAFVKTR